MEAGRGGTVGWRDSFSPFGLTKGLISDISSNLALRHRRNLPHHGFRKSPVLLRNWNQIRKIINWRTISGLASPSSQAVDEKTKIWIADHIVLPRFLKTCVLVVGVSFPENMGGRIMSPKISLFVFSLFQPGNPKRHQAKLKINGPSLVWPLPLPNFLVSSPKTCRPSLLYLSTYLYHTPLFHY